MDLTLHTDAQNMYDPYFMKKVLNIYIYVQGIYIHVTKTLASTNLFVLNAIFKFSNTAGIRCILTQVGL